MCRHLTLTYEFIDEYECKEKGHGRQSKWIVKLYDVSNHEKAKEWAGMKRIIHVQKNSKIGFTYQENNRYYISSKKENCAKSFHQGIRNHWKIENCLHWAKDVFHGEDNNRIANKRGAINWSIFSTIVINLHRLKSNLSILQSQIKFAGNLRKGLKSIRT